MEEPPPTLWKRTGKCCGTIENTENQNTRNYCGYWQCDFGCPVFLSVVMLFCFVIFNVVVVPKMPYFGLKIASSIEVGIVVALFFWSYLGAVCRDPGYLPYTWSKTRKTKYSWDELMEGTAVRKDQLQYVESIAHPPGCSFSRASGRYVIRADHICGWIANWVGKRNHKHFLLFQFWGGISSLSMFIWRWFPRSSVREEVGALWFLEMAAMIIEVIMAMALLCSTGSFTCEIMDNQTRVQRYKKENVSGGTRIDAMRNICGSGSMCCWICPTDSFPEEIQLEESQTPTHV